MTFEQAPSSSVSTNRSILHRTRVKVALVTLVLAVQGPAVAGTDLATMETPTAQTHASESLLSLQCRSLVATKRVMSLPWMSASGAHTALASAQHALLNAYTHGLDPADYGALTLVREARALTSASNATNPRILAFNQTMTAALGCYLQHVHRGHPELRALFPQTDVPREDWSATKTLQAAWASFTVPGLLDSAAPQTEEYDRLRALLTEYRAKAEIEAAIPLLQLSAARDLAPGERSAIVAALRTRLVFLGDMTEAARVAAQHEDRLELVANPAAANVATAIEALLTIESSQPAALVHATVPTDSLETITGAPAPVRVVYSIPQSSAPAGPTNGASANTPRFDAVTANAVKLFQRRHGLTPDSILGATTVQQLDTPMHVRVAQIELALERARWVPDFGDSPTIQVNMPAFSLDAHNNLADAGNLNQLASRVVIGKSGSSPTPIYVGEISRVEFNPYWYVPASIARRELVPKLRRNPAYLSHQGMEIVANGKIYRKATPALVEMLARGQASIQQRPGPRNALGQIKFVLPNSRSIYLHDTSARSLFAKDRRDFSHGCVRVEKPVELAQVILAADPTWTNARIEQILKRDRTVVARPAQAVKVAFIYQTVVVNNNGQASFLPDVYSHDSTAIESVARWANMTAQTVNATAGNGDEAPRLAMFFLN